MRRCRKYGPLIFFLGVGIIVAMLIPSTFYLFATGAVLIAAGIVIWRK